MSEVPVLESPVPDYEVAGGGEDEDEDEDDDEAKRKKKRLQPVLLPPADKGILLSPSYRYSYSHLSFNLKPLYINGVFLWVNDNVTCLFSLTYLH